MSLAEKREEWATVHQGSELRFHRADNYRWHDDLFLPPWIRNFGNFVGLSPDYFLPTDIILDIGTGSRPAFSYFTTGIPHSIEPLATEFIKIPEVAGYWTERFLPNVHARPAETLVGGLAGRCSFVNCWNCLDHCYDWRAIVGNIILYCSPGAIVSICTDTKSRGAGHPGIDSPAELFEMLVQSFKIERLEINYGDDVVRDVALHGIKR